jgi:hypothetical protein
MLCFVLWTLCCSFLSIKIYVCTWALLLFVNNAMATKVLWITSWVLVCSLPWTQCRRWIPIRLMRCVHTYWKILTIEGWGNPSHIRSIVEKTKEVSRKLGEIGWNVNQIFALGLEHDRISAQWVLNIMSENMLKKIWWCKHFEMESWSWTICCLMNCSNKGKHAWIKASRRSHAALKCC